MTLIQELVEILRWRLPRPEYGKLAPAKWRPATPAPPATEAK